MGSCWNTPCAKERDFGPRYVSPFARPAAAGRRTPWIRTAALEMFHNAFLIHDDIEDGSENRRGDPTLHTKYGIAIATNVGDGLNMLAMRTLLRNTRTLGLEPRSPSCSKWSAWRESPPKANPWSSTGSD